MAHALINIDVDDLARATKFYCHAFDLGQSGDADGRRRGHYRRHWTPVHLHFVVTNIRTAVERARAAGAVLEVPIAT